MMQSVSARLYRSLNENLGHGRHPMLANIKIQHAVSDQTTEEKVCVKIIQITIVFYMHFWNLGLKM